ncbi:hypothetical protein BC829DRAFT_85918 [Chytridium lagenaria]|nr:hypothetical protein BC829DRAFT_85918 [Chytridium lagenaria]
MLELFAETQDFWTLKELERWLQSQRGLSPILSRDTRYAMADSQVVLEKIGTSNYYWSFPSTNIVNKRSTGNATKDLTTAHVSGMTILWLTLAKERNQDLQRALEKAEIGREFSV